jgi:Kef-type K+ transport system membrane component KefB/mannitol/fructose-specific phosphotransferase system IIA component (Ntr-type)
MLDHMTTLVLQLGVIIFAARIGGILAERVRMPAMIGEIISGMVIGPYLLGSITLPGLNQPLFPLEGYFPVSTELYGFTTVASIILLFLVGLETDLEMFMRYSVAGSLVGLGGVIFSFLFGDIVTVIFSKYLFGAQYGFMHPVCLFLGVISTATSVGITARILSDKKKMQSPEGVTIVSGAVIDDVLGIISLAIVIGIIKSGQVEWRQISIIALKAVGIWLGFTALGLLFSRNISGLLKKFNDTTVIAIMSFGLSLIIAGVFEKAGLAMIVGAYVVGLSLSRTDLDYVIQDKLTSLHKFFIPIFFCVMGMMVDFSTITSKHIFLFGLVYTLACVLGKIIGCGLPPLFSNFNLRGALRIGLGMTPRGEVCLLITSIGLSAGILRQDTVGIVIIMTMVTTLITPSLLAASMTSEKPVIRKEVPRKEARRLIVFDMTTHETAGLVLGKVISVLHQEGFYIHRLDAGEAPQRLYQIRKDKISLGLSASAAHIQFDCREEDAVFINTLIYEVLADLEDMMKKLQPLKDISTIGKKIFDKTNGTVLKNKEFTKDIHASAVEIDLKANTKDEIIREMVDILIRSGQLSLEQREAAVKGLLERETVMPTGMQDGIALPHAKTDIVKKLVCAIGIKKSGIDFSSLDGKPSRIFIMILSPKDIAGPHIRFMADISKFMMDEARRQRILAAKTNWELYDILTIM